MKSYVTKRIITGFLSIFLSLVITFFIIKSAPGNPIRLLTGKENPNPQLVEYLTEKHGLNKSLPEQFSIYLGNLAKLDFGYSYVSDKPVKTIIFDRLPTTILLSTSSVVLSMMCGVGLCSTALTRNSKTLRRFLDMASYVLDSTPSFWLGMMLMLIFASWFKILPTSGMYDVRMQYTGIRKTIDLVVHMILPLLTLVLIQAPSYYKIFRASALKALSEDYVEVLLATGLSKKVTFNKFVVKNAILPVISVLGTSLAFSISGVTLTEIIFSWQGMGRLIVDSISRNDYPVLLGSYLMISVSICVFTIATDIAYAVVNPEIKLR